MLAIRLPKETEARLTELAKKTRRRKTFYARQAIIECIDNLEDTYLALKILESPGKIYTMEEIEKELGIED